MFERARRLLEEYYCDLIPKGLTKRAEHLLQEVRGRLRQLEWVHSRLVAIDAELSAEGRAGATPEAENDTTFKAIFTDIGRPDCETLAPAAVEFQKFDELQVLLEAFYHSAFRIRDIFRDAKEDLPGLSNFEASGVRDVRNYLAAHPFRSGGVIVASVAAGGPVGPQLRPLRWSLDSEGLQDEGLHSNARRFAEALERHLAGAA